MCSSDEDAELAKFRATEQMGGRETLKRCSEQAKKYYYQIGKMCCIQLRTRDAKIKSRKN